jgi:peroxiredoxin
MLLALAPGPFGSRVIGAQEPVRAGLVGAPKVGDDAPDFALPYLTAVGPGPRDQPFRLRAELGRVVVLVFAESPADSAARATWELLASQADSLFHSATVVTGVFHAAPGPVQALATSLAAPFKFLPDSLGRAFRRFGVVGRENRKTIAVFVVGYDGKVAFVSRRFRVGDRGELERIRAAARKAVG